MTFNYFVTNWVPSIGIFLISIPICILFQRFFLKFLHFINNRLPGDTNLDIAKSLQRPARLLILAAGFFTGVSISPLGGYLETFWLKHLMNSFFTICIYWVIYNLCNSSQILLKLIVDKDDSAMDKTIASSITTVLHAIVLCLGFASLVSLWGFNISGFIAGLSIGGLAFSLAAKDSLSNIFAGLVILVDRPFVVGDWIVCNNVEGVVETISFRSTCVRTFPQALVYIPNSLISTTSIVNYSKRNRHRLNITLGVTYSTSRKQMEELVSKIRLLLSHDPQVYPQDISVTFDNMNSSSLDIRIVCYCKILSSADFFLFKEKINLALLDLLEEVGTSAAFPSTSVYIEQMPKTDKK